MAANVDHVVMANFLLLTLHPQLLAKLVQLDARLVQEMPQTNVVHASVVSISMVLMVVNHVLLETVVSALQTPVQHANLGMSLSVTNVKNAQIIAELVLLLQPVHNVQLTFT